MCVLLRLQVGFLPLSGRLSGYLFIIAVLSLIDRGVVVLEHARAQLQQLNPPEAEFSSAKVRINFLFYFYKTLMFTIG